MKNKLVLFLLFLTIAKITVFVYANRYVYTTPFNSIYLGRVYSDSQYVKGSGSAGIGDDGLYAYAGYYYLFQGGDVSGINFEHPPLGKYLIGVSEYFFHNENIINLIYYILILLLTYKISLLLKADSMLAVMAVTLLSFDKLFSDNLTRSLLDFPFLVFFLSAVYFFLKGLSDPRLYIFSGISFGLAFSTRFFPSILIIYPILLLLVLKFRRKSLKSFLLPVLSVPVLYLLTHVSFFIYHPSLIEFIRHKKWMLLWWSGTPVQVGNIFRDIYTGLYVDSAGGTRLNEYWSVLIPIIITLAVFGVSRSIFKNKNIYTLTLYLISLSFLLYVAILTGGLQKFIMPVYPLLVILAVHNADRLYSIIRSWMRATFSR